jgi:hypothetical protein
MSELMQVNQGAAVAYTPGRMAENEVAMNVDVPAEIKEMVEETYLRLRLAGDKQASKKQVVANVLRRYLPVYEQERLKEIKPKKRS